MFDSRLGRWWNYRELAGEADRLAAGLRTDSRKLVFAFCSNGIGSLLAYLGGLQEQAVALLNATLNSSQRDRLVQLYEPEFIFEPTCEGDFGPPYQAMDLPVVEGRWWRRHQEPSTPIHPGLGLLLSTSGSTGSPKMVRLSLDCLRANTASIIEALGIDSQETAITSLPLAYSYGLSVVNTHLSAGARLILTDDSVLQESFWGLFRQHQCTSVAGVPYTYQMLERIGLEKMGLTSLKTMTQAGGRLDPQAVLKWHQRMRSHRARFVVMYGQTEATARMTVLPPERLEEKIKSVGRAIPGGSLSVLDGEIHYRGPNVMWGYASERAHLSAGDELGGELATGDLGYLDEEGFLYVTGRRGRFAKVCGLRIDLDYLEKCLQNHGPTAVTTVEETVVVFCQYGDDEALKAQRYALADELKIHHRFIKFHRVQTLPLTTKGKPDYAALLSGAL